MRKTIILFMVGAVACTKPNPNRCCVDPADCQANNIPIGSTCADGLLCRGNQCVAETCSTAAECDPSAPYCVTGMCDATCSDDTQCPGNGQDPGDRFCISGTCVVCRDGMQDCPATAPVCEMNVCRACVKDAECASNVCDVDTGMCVSDTLVRYASPSGVDTNDCSEAAPCTPMRAVGISDAAHPWVRLLPGTYAPNTLTISAKNFILVGTDASLAAEVNIGSQSSVTLRGLSNASYGCGGLANNSIVTIRDALSPSGYAGVGNCTMNIIGSYFGASIGSGYSDGAILNIDRSRFSGNFQTVVSDTAHVIVNITNSEFIDAGFRISFSTTSSTANKVYVAYSTFVTSGSQDAYAAGCGNQTGVPGVATLVDNIFYSYIPQATDAFLSTTGCTLDTNIMYPQTTRSAGTNGITLDPKLVDPPNGDLHLQTTSPAIDAAKVTATDPTVDFDGTTRPQGPRLDIGAFEYKP